MFKKSLWNFLPRIFNSFKFHSRETYPNEKWFDEMQTNSYASIHMELSNGQPLISPCVCISFIFREWIFGSLKYYIVGGGDGVAVVVWGKFLSLLKRYKFVNYMCVWSQLYCFLFSMKIMSNIYDTHINATFYRSYPSFIYLPQ